jgi:PilZ domain
MNNLRNKGRFPVRVDLHSADLPNFKAEVLDLSEGGARVKLRRASSHIQADGKFRFGAFLSPKVNSIFRGDARVAWIRQTLDGVEAGLEWEGLTSCALRTLRSALLKAAD